VLNCTAHENRPLFGLILMVFRGIRFVIECLLTYYCLLKRGAHDNIVM
jgi:hypothetical protein